jgi:hypothetical protein
MDNTTLPIARKDFVDHSAHGEIRGADMLLVLPFTRLMKAAPLPLSLDGSSLKG